MSTERDNAIKSVPYQSKVVKLTPTVAEGFLKLQELPGERKIKQKQLQQMMEAMLANRFRWEQVTLMTCEYGGVTYRDNGQHTCKAVLLLKGKLNIAKEVRVLHYKCRTEEELRLLYADTDGGIKRNQREKKMALLAGSAGFEGIPQGTLNLVTEGYALYRWEDPKERRRNNNPDQITEEIKAGSSDNALCSAVARFVVEHAQGHKLTFVRTDSVVAAMLATFHVDQEAAKTFWLSVFSGANLSENDSRLLLSRWLLESKAKAKSKDGTKDSKEDIFLMCLAAWNPYRRGRKLDALRMPRGRKRPELV